MEKRSVDGNEMLVCPFCNVSNFTTNPDCPEGHVFCRNCVRCVNETELKVLKIGEAKELESSDTKKSLMDFTKKTRHVDIGLVADAEIPKPSHKKMILVAVGISLLALAIGLVGYNGDIDFSFDDIPVGLTDKNYCRYILSNGACMNEQYIDYLSKQNFATECPEGYNEKYEFSMGRYCMIDTTDRPMQHDIICQGFGGDCIMIGITENFDRTKGKSYLPPDMIDAEFER